MAFLCLLICVTSFSQVGIGTTSPDTSSVLDISSTTQGLLTPRMTTAQRTAITTPAIGLLVYDTDEDAFYYYNNGSWGKLSATYSGNDYTGWAQYSDTQYTSSSPFVLTPYIKTTLPNNAGITLDPQKPVDVTAFYNSTNSTITGRSGDGINLVIEFKVIPTNNKTTKVTVAIDIGGSIGEIFTRDFITSKGVNVEHFYLSSFNAYTLGTWEANGGTIKIVSDFAAKVYDIRYVITRTHKAR